MQSQGTSAERASLTKHNDVCAPHADCQRAFPDRLLCVLNLEPAPEHLMQSTTALLLRCREHIPCNMVRSRSTLGQLTGGHRERRR